MKLDELLHLIAIADLVDHDTNVERFVVDTRKKRVVFATNTLSNDEVLLAGDVLTIAAAGGMPDTYWHSDQRIERARKVLGFSVEEARDWARERAT